MIFYKTDEEVEIMRRANLLVCKVHAHIASIIRPGIAGAEIDRQAEELIRDNGGVPGFKGLYDFPNTLCISVNEAIVHGIPSKKEFQDGDIVSVDCGAIIEGYNGDAAYTFCVGDVNEAGMQLCRATKTSLQLAVEQAVVGKRLGDIGYAVQNYIEKQMGYYVVKELVGHGVGRDLHEAPEVANYGKRGRGIKLRENLTIAIEPMVNMGTREVKSLKDGTVITRDKKPSAHYEHSVAVKKGKADILSDHEIIEAAILKNPNVKEVASLLEISV